MKRQSNHKSYTDACRTINDKNLKCEIETTRGESSRNLLVAINDKNLKCEIETPRLIGHNSYASPPINDKNLKCEIETDFGCVFEPTHFLTINDKNLKCEIETFKCWKEGVFENGRSTIRISSVRLKLLSLDCAVDLLYPINDKNLKCEIETTPKAPPPVSCCIDQR